MGFAREYLLNVYRDKKQTFAWKMNMTVKNSPILFDTAEFERYRINQINTEKKIMHSHMRMVM